MTSHALIARHRSGRPFELGTVGSLEAAARLRQALEHELGPIEIRELDEPPTVSAVPRAELMRRRVS